jgi:hypothetical protein
MMRCVNYGSAANEQSLYSNGKTGSPEESPGGFNGLGILLDYLRDRRLYRCRFLLCYHLPILIHWGRVMDYKKLALEIACFIVGVTGGLAAFTLLIWIIWRI